MPRRNGTQRRSSRVTLCVPLRLYEPGSDKRFGAGEAYSVKVSLWGGLLSVSREAPVSCGQKLLLTNQNTGQGKDARVAYVGQIHSNRRLIAVEFLEASPDFWGLTFPAVVPRHAFRSAQARDRICA